VAHLHIHVVPRRKKDGLRGFFWPRQKYESAAEMERVRDTLRAAIGATQRAPR
jgi:histidine triad (HIT) family protein